MIFVIDILMYVMMAGLILIVLGWVDVVIRCIIKWGFIKYFSLFTNFEFWVLGLGFTLVLSVLPFVILFSGKSPGKRGHVYSFSGDPVYFILAVTLAFMPHVILAYFLVMRNKKMKSLRIKNDNT